MAKKINFAIIAYWLGVILAYVVIFGLAFHNYLTIKPLEVLPNRENHILLWTLVFVVVSVSEMKPIFIQDCQSLQIKANRAMVFLKQWTFLLTLVCSFVVLMFAFKWAEVLILDFIYLFIN